MNSRKSLKRIGILAIMIIVVITFTFQPVSADRTYVRNVHKGKYYFKYDDDNNKIAYSKKKNGKYKSIPEQGDVNPYYITNGEEVIYLSCRKNRYYIKRFVISSKRIKTERKLAKGQFYEPCAVKGKYLWLTGWSIKTSNRPKTVYKLYRYNIKNKKLVLKKKGCLLTHLKGSYFIGYGKDRSKKTSIEGKKDEVLYNKTAIYQITNKGQIKKVRSLGCNYGDSSEYGEPGKIKTIYYATRHKLYRINYNGKNRKLIKTFKGNVISSVGYKCYVAQNGKCYCYTLKNGKWKETKWWN